MQFRKLIRPFGIAPFLALVLALSGCASRPQPTGVNDPLENTNRAVHAFNKGFDQNVFRPFAIGYTTVVPQPVTRSVSRFSQNLELPGRVVNSVLQARPEDAAHNTLRFMLNSTLGVLGIFDPAQEFGLEGVETDFGETLFVWGVDEGPYVEVPFFGPYTTREAVGFVVDFFNSPVLSSIDTAAGFNTRVGVYVLDRTEERARFDGLVNDIYNSTDSYAQARILYLQNRRFKLGRGGEDTYFDPYEDVPEGEAAASAPVDDLYFDPYEDPYADPYAQ